VRSTVSPRAARINKGDGDDDDDENVVDAVDVDDDDDAAVGDTAMSVTRLLAVAVVARLGCWNAKVDGIVKFKSSSNRTRPPKKKE
jgi:hypothetical protein